MIFNPFIYQSGGGSGPILIVTVTGATASSVVATKGGASVSLAYDSTAGKWWAALPSTGTWTVTASGSVGNTKSTTVSASSVTIYEATLQLSVLPDGYTELQSVGLTGSQYFDTGIDSAVALKMTTKATCTSSTSGGCGFCGVQTPVSGGSAGNNAYLDMRSSIRRLNMMYAPNMTVTATGSVAPNTSYKIETDALPGSESIKFNDVSQTLTKTSPYQQITSGYHIFFGARNNAVSSTIDTYFVGSIEYMQLIDASTNVLLADYLPARRDSDSVVGMVDLPTGNFYPSLGDPFVAGAVA